MPSRTAKAGKNRKDTREKVRAVPAITPHLWFDKEAREAAKFYTSVFPGSRIKSVITLHDTPSGSADVITIELSGQEFTLLNAGPLFKFNESISFMVHCETQEEIDYYWGKLSAVPEAEQCGWLKDKFGLSWQIVPTAMDEMLSDKDQKKIARVTEAFLGMKKLDIAALKEAAKGDVRTGQPTMRTNAGVRGRRPEASARP
jgi:predicted 3-demethylubiquinone-9 3-methyltransferase (glyoxalase superfamily)